MGQNNNMTMASTNNTRTITLPAREIPVTQTVDVLVIGGGPAGVAAAVGAARAGARVLLLEQAGFLGGVTTTNLYLRQSTLRGEGVRYRIIGGVAYELCQRVIAAGGGNLRLGHLTFDYEIAKRIWDELVRDAGVDVLFHTSAFDVIKEDETVRGVIALNKSGLHAVLAAVVVDASGDGDVAAKAGAPFEQGRRPDGLTQPVTMMMRFGGVDMEAFNAFLSRDPRLRETMARAAANGDFELYQDRLCSVIHWSGRNDVLNLNVTNQTHVDGSDAVQLSRATVEGRRQVWLLYDFLKKYVDGFESAWLIDTAARIGVRETRRFIGEYVLTEQDVMEGCEFPDGVALGSYPVDIHNPDGLWVKFVHIKAPCYGIPYRCLVPLRVEHLLVAGRIISTTHEALASTRVMFTCMAVGHAAGIAAALAQQLGASPRQVNVTEVQAELVRQGAIISGVQARELNAPATLAPEADVAEYIFHSSG